MKRFLVGDDLFERILDAMPSPVFIMDGDARIFGYNLAGAHLCGIASKGLIRMAWGEALHCINASKGPEGSGGAEACRRCVIRNAVNSTLKGGTVVRKRSEMQRIKGSEVEQIQMLVTAVPFPYGDETFALVILEDVTELMQLRALLPICSSCKKIRNDRKYWQELEAFLSEHLDMQFTHGLCPECARRLYPDLAERG